MQFTQLTNVEYAKMRQNAPLWQSLEWKAYQESLGRETRLYGLKSGSGELAATALVILDKTAFGLCAWDIPRGPICDDPESAKELINHIIIEAKKDRCITLYFSPSNQLLNVNSRLLNACQSKPEDQRLINCKLSQRREQPSATLTLDLALSDDELLAQMKQKGRYNIRLAQKKGVKVTKSDDVNAFYELLERTSKRDGFRIKPKSHYKKFLEVLPGSFLLLAYVTAPHHSSSDEGQAVSALIGTVRNNTGYYYYGASDDCYKNLMAPYLLQWEAMRLCRKRGCKKYDLFGIAPNDDPKHPWAGITKFKKQFGGEVVQYQPERKIVMRPVAKKLIEWKRMVLG